MLLADYGAQVVKAERPRGGPYRGGLEQPDAETHEKA